MANSCAGEPHCREAMRPRVNDGVGRPRWASVGASSIVQQTGERDRYFARSFIFDFFRQIAPRFMRKLVGNWLKCELTGEKTRGREVGFCRNRDGEDIGKSPHYSERHVLFEQSKARERLQRARYCIKR